MGTRGFMGGGWGDKGGVAALAEWAVGSPVHIRDQGQRRDSKSRWQRRLGLRSKGGAQRRAGWMPARYNRGGGGSAYSGQGKREGAGHKQAPCLPSHCLQLLAAGGGGAGRAGEGRPRAEGREGGRATGPRTQDRTGALCYKQELGVENQRWASPSALPFMACSTPEKRTVLGTACWVLFAGCC